MVIVCALVLISVCVVAALVLARLDSKRPSWPVFSHPVMSAAELDLYARLTQALPDLRVFPQVQLCRFVEVRPGQKRVKTLNRYDRLSADFVIAQGDARVVCVIELDDVSHDRPAARVRDAKKNAVLAAAGIPILRFRAGKLPSVSELAMKVEGAASNTA